MLTQCSADLFGFAPVERHAVVAGFGGGRMTSDAGALLLGAADRAIGLVERFAACFADGRAAALIEHEVRTLVGQRVFGIALGYEDLVDHDQLRHDPTMAVLAGKLAARRGIVRRSPPNRRSTGWSWAGGSQRLEVVHAAHAAHTAHAAHDPRNKRAAGRYNEAIIAIPARLIIKLGTQNRLTKNN